MHNENEIAELEAVVEEIMPMEEVIEDDVLVEDRPPVEVPVFKVGDAVKVRPGATYTTGGAIPANILNSKLYVRQVQKNGNYGIGVQMTGRIAGSVKPEDLVVYTTDAITAADFKPYLVIVKEDGLEVKSRPEVGGKTLTTLHKDCLFTIIGEKNDWGHLKIGGWIPLDSTVTLNKQ